MTSVSDPLTVMLPAWVERATAKMQAATPNFRIVKPLATATSVGGRPSAPDELRKPARFSSGSVVFMYSGCNLPNLWVVRVRGLESPHDIRHEMAGPGGLVWRRDDQIVQVIGEGEVQIVGEGVGPLHEMAL